MVVKKELKRQIIIEIVALILLFAIIIYAFFAIDHGNRNKISSMDGMVVVLDETNFSRMVASSDGKGLESGGITYTVTNNNTSLVKYKVVAILNENLQHFDEFEYFDSNFKTETNSLIVSYPFGIYSDNIFVNNLGPRIPVKINLINNLSTNIKTKVTDYGINSLLLEMYIVVELKHEIVASKIYEVQSTYELLVSSKLLQGSIPNYFGGVIEKNSSIITE